MKRSAMPARRTELRRTGLRRGSSQPTNDGPRAPRRRHKNSLPAFRLARAKSFGISAGCCAVCGKVAGHGHHRVRRSQGGPDTAENVMPVCWECHNRIHSSDARLAYQMGWLVRPGSPIVAWWELPFWTMRRGDAA